MDQSPHTLIVAMVRKGKGGKSSSEEEGWQRPQDPRKEVNQHDHNCNPFIGIINGRRVNHRNHSNEDNQEGNHVNQPLLERILNPKFDEVTKETKPRTWIGKLSCFF